MESGQECTRVFEGKSQSLSSVPSESESSSGERSKQYYKESMSFPVSDTVTWRVNCSSSSNGCNVGVEEIEGGTFSTCIGTTRVSDSTPLSSTTRNVARCIPEVLYAVSYTHLTLPTNREV